MRETAACTGELYFSVRGRNVVCAVIRFTSIAASVAHVGGNEAPLVCGWVVKLYRGEVTGAVVASDHVQQPVNGTDTWRRELYIQQPGQINIYVFTVSFMVQERRKIHNYVFIGTK